MKTILKVGLMLAVWLIGAALLFACSSESSTSLCGNGVVDTGETCDTKITSGTGACPTATSCNDDDACTTDTIKNDGTCTATCTHTPITTEACTSVTWIGHIKTVGTMIAPDPVNTQTNTNIETIQRMVVTSSTIKFDVCYLDTTAWYSPTIPYMTIDYSSAIPTFHTTLNGTISGTVGQPITIPELKIVTGWNDQIPDPAPTTDECLPCKCTSKNSSGVWENCTPAGCPQAGCSTSIDSDNDGMNGISVLLSFGGGQFTMEAYIGITIDNTFPSATLTDANTITGIVHEPSTSYSFGTDAKSSAGVTYTAPHDPDVPFTMIKLAGNVSCADVLASHCPLTTTACTP